MHDTNRASSCRRLGGKKNSRLESRVFMETEASRFGGGGRSGQRRWGAFIPSFAEKPGKARAARHVPSRSYAYVSFQGDLTHNVRCTWGGTGDSTRDNQEEKNFYERGDSILQIRGREGVLTDWKESSNKSESSNSSLCTVFALSGTHALGAKRRRILHKKAFAFSFRTSTGDTRDAFRDRRGRPLRRLCAHRHPVAFGRREGCQMSKRKHDNTYATLQRRKIELNFGRQSES